MVLVMSASHWCFLGRGGGRKSGEELHFAEVRLIVFASIFCHFIWGKKGEFRE